MSWFMALWRMIRRFFRMILPFYNNHKSNSTKPTQTTSSTISSLQMLANQFKDNNSAPSSIATVISPVIVENTDVKPLIEMSATLGEPYYDERSKWEAMRLKKHFTVQSSLMLKENETTYVGAFAVATELRTVKKSPLSCMSAINV